MFLTALVLGKAMVLLTQCKSDNNSNSRPFPKGSDELKKVNTNSSASDNKLQANAELENEAIEILKKNCSSCHGETGAALGGLSHITDVSRLVNNGKVIPNNPEDSPLYQRISGKVGNIMPTSGPMSADKIKVIRDWIQNLSLSQKSDKLLSQDELYEKIEKDISDNFKENSTLNIRYFSLHHLLQSAVSSEEVNTTLKAFSKTINSLSRSTEIVKPIEIEKNSGIYRIDISEIKMSNDTLNEFLDDFYPYTIIFGEKKGFQGFPSESGFGTIESKIESGGFDDDSNKKPNSAIENSDKKYNDLKEKLGTDHILIRMDWFVATSTLAPHYKKLLQLPSTLQELEISIGIDDKEDTINNRDMRTGFKNSGVSEYNRMFKRQSSTFGYYYKSYDFASSTGKQDILRNPLTSASEEFSALSDIVMEEDGGETIFRLPNGFIGFYLNTSNGRHIHKGPTSIVSNPKGPAQLFNKITNGLSCFSCHKSGVLPKKDQVRQYVKDNSNLFSQAQFNKIMALYPEPQKLEDKIKEDAKDYQDKLALIGISASEDDPINTTFQYYYSKLTLNRVAGELNTTLDKLQNLLKEEPFNSNWTALTVNESISREDFNKLFSLAIENLESTQTTRTPRTGDFLVTNECINQGDELFEENFCIVNSNSSRIENSFPFQ